MNMHTKTSVFLAFALALAALALSGCDSNMAQRWDDPVYFGDEDDLGKESNGAGTGYETWKFDNW